MIAALAMSLSSASVVTNALCLRGSRIRQGHYALEPYVEARFPPADVTIARIGDLLKHDLSTLQQGR